MSLQKILDRMTNVLSRDYIAKMLAAKEKFHNAPIYDPRSLELEFEEPNPEKITKICEEFMKPESIRRIIADVQNAHEKYVKYVNNYGWRQSGANDKFGNFKSYQRKYQKYMNENGYNNKNADDENNWMEPMYRFPITIPCDESNLILLKANQLLFVVGLLCC